MRRLLSYGLGVFLLVAGVASVVQSVNPAFLASADAASISVSRSSAVLLVIGSIFLVLGSLIIILKILKGKANHGQERY